MADPNPNNEGWDSPRVAKALRQQHRASRFRAFGAFALGLLFGLFALATVVGSIRHEEYSPLIGALLLGAVSAYFFYSARSHFKSS